jgi:hypothetical protein
MSHHLTPRIRKGITSFLAFQFVFKLFVAMLAFNGAKGIIRAEGSFNSILAGLHDSLVFLSVVTTFEKLCVLDWSRRVFARNCWEIVAIMQLINVYHLLAAAHARGISRAWQIAPTMPTFISVMVERRAVTLVAISQSHKLDSTDIFAEMKTQLGRHWHPILLGDFIFVPDLGICLCVEHATNLPHSSGAPHRIN